MDFNQVNINKIQYRKNFLYYHNKKFIVETPIMKCVNGIENNNGKYSIRLEFDKEQHQTFYKFMKNLEENNRKHCRKESFYKSSIQQTNDKIFITLKVPYRYGKIETEITSDKIYLPTIENVKSDIDVRCNLEIKNIWHYTTDNEIPMAGCIILVKELMICV